MRRKRSIISVLLLCTAVVLSACSTPTAREAAEVTIEHSLSKIINEPTLVASSNPNDYITSNPEAYAAILSTGEEGLHVLLEQMESSPDNGLKEWIMAKLSSEMLRENNPVKTWGSGKDWLRQYKINVE